MPSKKKNPMDDEDTPTTIDYPGSSRENTEESESGEGQRLPQRSYSRLFRVRRTIQRRRNLPVNNRSALGRQGVHGRGGHGRGRRGRLRGRGRGKEQARKPEACEGCICATCREIRGLDAPAPSLPIRYEHIPEESDSSIDSDLFTDASTEEE